MNPIPKLHLPLQSGPTTQDTSRESSRFTSREGACNLGKSARTATTAASQRSLQQEGCDNEASEYVENIESEDGHQINHSTPVLYQPPCPSPVLQCPSHCPYHVVPAGSASGRCNNVVQPIQQQTRLAADSWWSDTVTSIQQIGTSLQQIFSTTWRNPFEGSNITSDAILRHATQQHPPPSYAIHHNNSNSLGGGGGGQQQQPLFLHLLPSTVRNDDSNSTPRGIRPLLQIGGVVMVILGIINLLNLSLIILHPSLYIVQIYEMLFGVIIVILEAGPGLFTTVLKERLASCCYAATTAPGKAAFYILVGAVNMCIGNFLDFIVGLYILLLGTAFVVAYNTQQPATPYETLHLVEYTYTP